jgi:hypothetical protein
MEKMSPLRDDSTYIVVAACLCAAICASYNILMGNFYKYDFFSYRFLTAKMACETSMARWQSGKMARRQDGKFAV